MKKDISVKTIISSILFCWAVGGISSFLTLDGLHRFQSIRKPVFTPPPIVFPIAWTLLLALIGIGLGLIISNHSAESVHRERAISAFSVQITFFFCWMIWFFGLGWYGFAAIWLIGLIISIIWMMYRYAKVNPIAAWLQLPYLVWCCFALYLNIGVWALNR